MELDVLRCELHKIFKRIRYLDNLDQTAIVPKTLVQDILCSRESRIALGLDQSVCNLHSVCRFQTVVDNYNKLTTPFRKICLRVDIPALGLFRYQEFIGVIPSASKSGAEAAACLALLEAVFHRLHESTPLVQQVLMPRLYQGLRTLLPDDPDSGCVPQTDSEVDTGVNLDCSNDVAQFCAWADDFVEQRTKSLKSTFEVLNDVPEELVETLVRKTTDDYLRYRNPALRNKRSVVSKSFDEIEKDLKLHPMIVQGLVASVQLSLQRRFGPVETV